MSGISKDVLSIVPFAEAKGKLAHHFYDNTFILKSTSYTLYANGKLLKQGKKSLRIDNSGWSVNSSALFGVAGMRWYQRKYHVLYTIRKPIINSIY